MRRAARVQCGACSGCGSGSGWCSLAWRRWSRCRAGATAASGSLYQGPVPRPGPNILYRPPAKAPQLENSGIWRAEADPDLGRERLPRGRVPLPGLPLRRPRRPGPVARPGRSPHRGRQLLAAQRHLHLPDRPGLRQQRRRPGRAPGQAARQRHRLPDHPQHAQGPVARSRPRSRSAARRSPARSPTGPTRPRPRELFLTVHGHARRPACAPATRPAVDAGAAGVDRRAAPPDPGPRPAPRLGPRRAHRPPRRRRRALEQGGRPVPRARRRPPTATQPGRRRRALQPHRLLQRRLPLRRALAAHVPARHRVRRPGLVARPRSRATRSPTATSARSTPTVDFAKLEAGVTDDMRGKPEGVPTHRPDGPDPRQPLRDQAGRRLLDRLRQRQRLPGRAARPPPALRDLRPQEARPAARLRPDPAAALARRQLQPVRRQPQPVAARRARPGLDRDHARGPRPGRLVLRPRRRRHLRGLGRRRQALPARSRAGRRSPATRWAATAPTSSRPSTRTCSRGRTRSSARPGWASGCRPPRRSRAATPATPTACSPRFGTSRS